MTTRPPTASATTSTGGTTPTGERLRGLAATLLLAALVIGSPVALTAWGRAETLGLMRPSAWLSPDDGSILLGLATLVGWIAWVVFTVCVVAEAVGMATCHRHHPRVPGLGAVQGIAAGLLVASLAVLSPAARSTAAPPAPPVAVAISHAGATPQSTTAEAATSGSTATDEASGMEVVIGPDDDLWSLASSWYGDGTSWRRIAAANPGIDAENPAVGSPIVLPGIPATMHLPTGHTGGGHDVGPEDVERISPVVTVRSGDTLSAIARKHLGDQNEWPRIWQLNRDLVKDPDHIEPGWRLVLPGAPGDAHHDDAHTPAPTNAAAAPTQKTPAVIPSAVATPGEDSREVQAADPTEEVTPAVPLQSTSDATTAPDPVPPQAGALEMVRAESDDGDPTEMLRTGLAGLSLFLAGGVAGTLVARRRQQLFSRPLGRRVPVIDGAPRRARQVLDTAAAQVRSHPEGGATGGDEDPESLPATTVVLGTDGDRPVLLDLATAGGLVGIDADDDLAVAMIASMSLSLVATPWSGGLDLLVIGEDLAWLADAGGDDVLVTTAEEVTASLADLPGGDPMAVAQVILSSRPLDLPSPDVLAASGVVVLQPGEQGLVISVTDEEHARLDGHPQFLPQLVTGPMRRAIVSLVATTSSPDTEPAPWWDTPRRGREEEPERIDEEPPIPVTQFGLPDRVAGFRDHRLPQRSHDGWQGGQGIDDASITEEATVSTTSGASVPTQLPTNPVDAPAPVLRLLGPVDLVGARGTSPSKASRQCLEYCAWLLRNPGARSGRMAEALMVAEPTRRSNVSRLRRWLGRDDAGEAYLPEGYDGSLRLSESVTTDWERLELLIAGGVRRTSLDSLVAALDLVRGAPLADAAPGQWHWAEEWRVEMVQTIRDIGVEVARRAMEDGDSALAERALARAGAACPDDEVLLVERIRLADVLGDRAEVERLVYVLSRQARRLGVDLSEGTVRVLQEVMEGQVRARAV